MGAYCLSGSTTPTYCAADKFNPYVGQPEAGDCQTCNASAVPRYTSYQGADYCDVPYVNTTCPDGEQPAPACLQAGGATQPAAHAGPQPGAHAGRLTVAACHPRLQARSGMPAPPRASTARRGPTEHRARATTASSGEGVDAWQLVRGYANVARLQSVPDSCGLTALLLPLAMQPARPVLCCRRFAVHGLPQGPVLHCVWHG